MNNPEIPSEGPADPIAARYEQLLIVRLIDLVKIFQSDASELCEAAGFLNAWPTVERLSVDVLFQSSHEPLLDCWVQTAEGLVSFGIHKRYQHAHAIRHLKDFARLVLSWIVTPPGELEGKVQILGRTTIPLLFGRVLLLLQDRVPDSSLSWRAAGGMLKIDLDSIGTIAEIELSAPYERSALASRCALLTLPEFGGIKLDVWTPEYVGERSVSSTNDLAPLEEMLQRATSQLTPEQQRVVNSFCCSATISSANSRWTAGLINLSGHPQEITSERLVEYACQDRLKRLLKLIPIRSDTVSSDIGGDLNTVIVELGARRTASKLFGKQMGRDDEGRWEKVASYLSSTNAGIHFLQSMGEITEGAAPGPSVSNSGYVLLLSDVLKSAGLQSSSAQRLELRKTRSNTAALVDWRAPDSLVRLSPSELSRVYDTATASSSVSEAGAYCASISAYLLGRFEDCQESVLKCLKFDSNVEEYWHLLAFTLRYLGRYDGFKKIIFEQERRLSDIVSLLGSGQTVLPPEVI